jgi:hypothetical protein
MKRTKKTASKSAKSSAKAAPKRAAKKAEAKEQQQQPGHVIERPDGFYVQAPSGEESGPYTTLAEAEAELLAAEVTEPDLETGDLQEAESDIGVNEWIDPETGGPAEDSVPRIEDH